MATKNLTQFTSSLLGSISSDGNTFVSPLSIFAVLALAAEGAREETKNEMTQTLRIDVPLYELAESTSRLLQESGITGIQEEKLTLTLANRIWVEKSCEAREEFMEIAQNIYFSSLGLCDFKQNTEQERQNINKWVLEATQNKISDLIPSGSITPQTFMVIANAIYFKANWILPFPRVVDEKFSRYNGSKIDVKMMKQVGVFLFQSLKYFDVLEKEYISENKRLAMVFIKPKSAGKKDLEKVFDSFEPEFNGTVPSFLSKMEAKNVEVSIPKFKIEYSINLKPLLQGLGIKHAFSDQTANFGGISDKPLYISAIFHKAFVQVDEKGTEAAAATAMVNQPKSAGLFASKPKPLVFQLDRPFVFLIWDRKSEAILFSGIVTEPIFQE